MSLSNNFSIQPGLHQDSPNPSSAAFTSKDLIAGTDTASPFYFASGRQLRPSTGADITTTTTTPGSIYAPISSTTTTTIKPLVTFTEKPTDAPTSSPTGISFNNVTYKTTTVKPADIKFQLSQNHGNSSFEVNEANFTLVATSNASYEKAHPNGNNEYIWNGWNTTVNTTSGETINGTTNLTIHDFRVNKNGTVTNQRNITEVFQSNDSKNSIVSFTTTTNTPAGNVSQKRTTTTTSVINGQGNISTTQANINITTDESGNVVNVTITPTPSTYIGSLIPTTTTTTITPASVAQHKTTILTNYNNSTTTAVTENNGSLVITNETTDENGTFSTVYIFPFEPDENESNTLNVTAAGNTIFTPNGSIQSNLSAGPTHGLTPSPTPAPTDIYVFNHSTGNNIGNQSSITGPLVPFSKFPSSKPSLAPTSQSPTIYFLEDNQTNYSLSAINSSDWVENGTGNFTSDGWKTTVNTITGETFYGTTNLSLNQSNISKNGTNTSKNNITEVFKSNNVSIVNSTNYTSTTTTTPLSTSTTSTKKTTTATTSVIGGMGENTTTQANVNITTDKSGNVVSVTITPTTAATASPIPTTTTTATTTTTFGTGRNTTILRSADNSTNTLVNASNGSLVIVNQTEDGNFTNASIYVVPFEPSENKSTTTTINAAGTTTKTSTGSIQSTLTTTEPTSSTTSTSTSASTTSSTKSTVTKTEVAGSTTTTTTTTSGGFEWTETTTVPTLGTTYQPSTTTTLNSQGLSTNSFGPMLNPADINTTITTSTTPATTTPATTTPETIPSWVWGIVTATTLAAIGISIAARCAYLTRKANIQGRVYNAISKLLDANERHDLTTAEIQQNLALRFQHDTILNNRAHLSSEQRRALEDLLQKIEANDRAQIAVPDADSDSGIDIELSVSPPNSQVVPDDGAGRIPTTTLALKEVATQTGRQIQAQVRSGKGGSLVQSFRHNDPPPRELQQTNIDKNFSNINEKVGILILTLAEAQGLAPYSSKKAELLGIAATLMYEIQSDKDINADSKELFTSYLVGAYRAEFDAVTMWHLDHEGAVAMLGNTKNLNLSNKSSIRTCDVNFQEKGAWLSSGKSTVFFGDSAKPIFITSENKDRSVHLDDEHFQYIGSDAKEFVTLSGKGGTTFNIATDDGDDTVFIPYTIFTDINSVVNILGGAGKNTYIIQVKDDWDSLAGSIHIWDFDSTKDTIVFETFGSFKTPDIAETKRTIFGSPYSFYQQNNGSILLRQEQSPFLKAAWFINKAPSLYARFFKAAQHEFKGDGIPLLKLDENNYDVFSPDRFFSNANAFKYNAMGDIVGSTQTKAEILVNTTLNTQFSQLESNSDHDLFKVHLTAGNSYVFTMNHKPDVWGSTVLNTSLVLKDAQGNSIANSNILSSNKSNGNSRIVYIALKDGDFYLDASGSVEGGINSVNNGKYTISAIEIPRKDAIPSSLQNGHYSNIGDFDGVTNHVGFKMSLSAGDYIDLSFGSLNMVSPKLSITNVNGDNIKTRSFADQYVNNQTFLAQKSGDYFIDATVNNELVTSPMSYQLRTVKNRDIENGKDTMAELSINTVITSNLYESRDHDWFKVQLEANKQYQFDLQKASKNSNLDTYLRLRDSNGKELVFNDDFGGSLDSRLTYKSAASGDYYIDAASYSERTSGAYTLSYKVI